MFLILIAGFAPVFMGNANITALPENNIKNKSKLSKFRKSNANDVSNRVAVLIAVCSEVSASQAAEGKLLSTCFGVLH